MIAQVREPDWFTTILNQYFEPNPQGRFSADQIAFVINQHYHGLGLEGLNTECREVGRCLANHPEIGRTSHRGCSRYHLRLRPEVNVDLEGKTEVKAYRPRQSLLSRIPRAGTGPGAGSQLPTGNVKLDNGTTITISPNKVFVN